MGPEAITGDWAAAMQKAQAELLRQWTELGNAWTKAGAAAGAAAGAGTSGSPGAAASAFPGAAASAAAGAAMGGAGSADDIARHFLRQCEQYLGVSRSLWELLGRASASTDNEQRARLFTDGLGGLQQQFASLWAATPFGAASVAATNPFNPGAAAGAVPGMANFAMPGFAMPGFAMPGFGMPGFGAPGQAASAFNLPALGPTRESQESMQRLAQLGMRCAQAQLQVSGQWNDIIGKALRELGERIAPRLKSGGAPASMKEVYDLWVDSAETVYAQAARGAAFVQAQAELTNSLSQLRSAQRELLEEWAKQFDLPTRAELNSIHQQLRELKAALRR
jgi:class III poly(R)-hydroxyalkanoic acid synthase PhaE subunit